MKHAYLVAGLLLPVSCGSPASPPAPPQVLAGGLNPSGIAVDETSVYVSEFGEAPLMTIPLDGGPTVSLGVHVSGKRPAVDQQRLYWGDGAALLTCDKSNCAGSVVQLATVDNDVWDVVVDATSAYFTTIAIGDSPSPSQIMKVDKNSAGAAAPVQIAAARRPGFIAVDATSVYWLEEQAPNFGVMKAPIAGGPAVQLSISDPVEPSGLAIDDEDVYYASGAGAVFRVAKDGGATHVVVANLGEFPGDLATDGQHLYIGTDSKLLSVPLVGGGFPAALASGLPDGAGCVALDESSVYMTNPGSGNVLKVAK